MLDSIAVLIEKHTAAEALLGFAAQYAREAKDGPFAIHLLSVREPTPWYSRFMVANAEELERAASQALESRLEQLAQPLRAAGLSVTSRVHAGKASIETARGCHSVGAVLLLKQLGVEGNESATAMDLQVLRQAPCPVFMLKRDLAAEIPRRVLAAVAPAVSPTEADVLNLHEPPDLQRLALNQRVLDSAFAFSQDQRAEIHVAHAWHVPGESLLRSEPLLSPQQIRDYVEGLRKAHEEALSQFLAASGRTIPAERTHLVKGSAAEVLCELVHAQRIDLLVMGTVVRSGVPGFLLGSTTESIARAAPCSILALKPEGFVSPALQGGAPG